MPNILLITTDQQRFDHLGLAGIRGIDTPHLDRLGSQGVHFNRAYTCCPICTPARLALLTGQYPSVHRGYSIGVSVDPFPRPTIADLLSDAGNATALFGKAHFVRREDEERHFAGIDSPPAGFYRNNSGPFIGFDCAKLERRHTTNGVPGMHYRVFLEDAGVEYADWYPDVHGKHDHAQAGLWNIPAGFHDTNWVTDNTIQWIRSMSRRSKDTPWFAWASYQDPHEPFVCPDPWFSTVRMNEVSPLEGHRDGEFDDKPPFYRQAYETGFGKDLSVQYGGAVPGNWRSFDDGHGIPSAFNRIDLTGKELDALQATLGMVAFIDHGVGRIIAVLEDLGMLDNTIIVFTTDHGEIHGHHGLWHKGLFPYEDNQRIPLLIYGPGHVKARGTVQALANLVDVPATLLSFAGVEKPQGMQGVDLGPILDGSEDTVQDATVIELEATQKVYQQTMITDQYKIVLYRADA